MRHFKILQSLWAMERRQPDGIERTLDENLAMIHGAGFDGISMSFTDADASRPKRMLISSSKHTATG